MANERSRDFGGAQSPGPDQGAAERRDPGADALLELARLIGGQNDPFAPEAPKANSRLSEPGFPDPRVSEQRLGDVSRAAASQPDAGRDPLRSKDRSVDRRNPDFAEPRAPVAGPPDFPPVHDRGDPVPDRRDYDFSDSRSGSRSSPTYRRRRDEDQYSGEYGDGEYGEPDDEGEEPTPRRRPTKVIMAVLGLAVFGSAAAYGYRHWVNASPSEAPPIIRADNSPTKITPMSDVKAEGGRVGDRGGEQLVRRDEDPVNLGTGAGGGSSEVPGDPRPVRTVPIRADQGTASSPDRPASRASASPQVQAAVAAPPPAPRQAAAPPLPPPQRQAAVAPAVSAPPPDTSAPVDAGSYTVQLVAVRSEADAQSEFRRLQTKFSSVLSGRQPLIRRKDKGDQVFYAAGVGPFGAKGDADQFCEQLKAAGGSCYVYKN